jgi:hypothetical protein
MLATRVPGNAHSTEDWRLVLEPVIARYPGRGIAVYLRADAAFAKPEIYELLEAEGIRYAIRLPANQVLQRQIGHLLTWPVGRPPKKPVLSLAVLAALGYVSITRNWLSLTVVESQLRGFGSDSA